MCLIVSHLQQRVPKVVVDLIYVGGFWDSLEEVRGAVVVFDTILLEQLDPDRVPGRLGQLRLGGNTGSRGTGGEPLVQRSAPRCCAHLGLSGRGCVLRLPHHHRVGGLGWWVPQCALGEGLVDRSWIFRPERILGAT